MDVVPNRGVADSSILTLAVVAIVVLVSMVGCSGDDSELGRALDGESDEASVPAGASEPDVANIDWEECEAARLLLYDRVAAPDDEVVPVATVRSAWAELAATVPVELSEQTAAVADVVNRDFDDPESVTARDANLFISGLDQITAWALDACPPTEPVWGCRERSAVRSTESESTDERFDSPEMAAVREGERVEALRSDDEVVFGWLDADGYVGRRLVVARDGDEWFPVEEVACDDLEARRSGGPLDRSQPTSTTVAGG